MKNENSNKGSIIILTIIGIATLLVAVIGATFAFFTAQVTYNGKPKDVTIQSGEMIIQFNSKNSIDYKGAIPGRPEVYQTNSEGNQELITKNRMQFTLTSGEKMGVGTPYDIYLKITKNEFLQSKNLDTGYTNLVYYIQEFSESLIEPSNTVDSSLRIPNVLGTMYSVSPLLEYKDNVGVGKFKKTTVTSMLDSSKELNVGGITEEKGLVKIGIIPLVANPDQCPTDNPAYKKEDGACYLKISDGSVLGNYSSGNEWYFELWLYETGDEQNEDQGKEFNASIEVVTHDLDKISNEVIE